MEKKTNCISDRRFANLLFVNVRIGDAEVTALFDTGAGMTVITQSLLARLHVASGKESFHAGNNTGMIRELHAAVIPSIQIGDVHTDECKILVTDDADFSLNDESGSVFPAEMLFGWDVISRYRWSYSVKKKTLSISASERTAGYLKTEIKQGPIVFPEYAGRRFKARVDTGHTGSILSAAWRSWLSDIKYHETVISGIGSSQLRLTSYVPMLQLQFQNKVVCLCDVDIFDKLYGQPAEIEALLGYDFLEGRDWLLDQEFRFMEVIMQTARNNLFIIERAQPEEAAALLDYLKIIGSETDNLSFGAEGVPLSLEAEQDYLRSQCESTDNAQYFAKVDGEIIGTASLNRRSNRMSHRGVFGISLKKAWWGCGAASALMEAILAFAKENGFEQLNLEVRSDNVRAIHLYEKYGFRKLCTFPNFFKINGEPIDFDLMNLELNTDNNKIKRENNENQTNLRL